MGNGSPPKVWARCAVELLVSDHARSLAFWTGPLGFAVRYDRPTQKFAYLERPDGAQMMMYERDGDWETGPLEPPFGRGVIIQIEVEDVDAVHAGVIAAGLVPYVALRENGVTGATGWVGSANFSCRIRTGIWS